MKVGKRGFAIKSLFIILLGFVVNYLCGYIIAYSQYLTVYKIHGLEIVFEEFVKNPKLAFDVLIQGNNEKEVFEMIHKIYTNKMFHIIYLCFYLYLVFSYFTKGRKLDKQDASDYGSHGSARWATKNEIKKTFMRSQNGFILGEVGTFFPKLVVHPVDSELNQIISTFGGSGTGKTSGYGIPNILHNADKIGDSLVITDPKGELYNKTSKYLRKRGYEIIIFNLLDMKRSMRYNPLDYVFDTKTALSLANMIISNTDGGKKSGGDSFWKDAEMAYFAALVMYLKEQRPKSEQTIKSILQLGTRIGKDEALLDLMFSQLPDDSEALEMYNIFKLAEDKTRSGILIGFGVRLKLWVSKEVANLTKTSDFDLNQLGKKKTALFLLIPDEDTTFDLIPALMLDQAFSQLYKQAGKNITGRLEVDVKVIGDELANIAAINNLERKVSTMRSRGISLIPIFQSITQFRNRYDNDRWSEILASSDTIVFLGTNDKMTAEYFSQELGKTTWLINSVSESENNRGTSGSKSHNVVGRALMDPNEIKKMTQNHVIVFQRGSNPIFMKKHFYYKQKKWKNLEEVNWYDEIQERIDPPVVVIDPFDNQTREEIAVSSEISKNDPLGLGVNEEVEIGYVSQIMQENELVVDTDTGEILLDNRSEIVTDVIEKDLNEVNNQTVESEMVEDNNEQKEYKEEEYIQSEGNSTIEDEEITYTEEIYLDEEEKKEDDNLNTKKEMSYIQSLLEDEEDEVDEHKGIF